jgi:hypothetical protein
LTWQLSGDASIDRRYLPSATGDDDCCQYIAGTSKARFTPDCLPGRQSHNSAIELRAMQV